jgi:3-oxoacyl-[acyl-carrier-protein] synthase II
VDKREEIRRACITGCGALSAIGNSTDAFWSALLAGHSGFGPIRSFDTDGIAIATAGEVKDFRPEIRLTGEQIGRLERIEQFALFAAQEALEDAQLDLSAVDRSRVGVILATTLGGMLVGEEYQERQARSEGDRLGTRLHHLPYYAAATTLARELETRGPVVSPSIACASGTHAVGLALDFIRTGHGDVFVVGGAETLCRFVVAGFNCLRATTADVVRPFDSRRSGLLLGEGAAVLVVEEREHARARGARVDVEVVGSGLAADATHMTAPARDGAGAARAIRMALADAGLAPEAVDFVSAHGTGTIFNDAMEAAALVAIFGERATRIPVNSIKGAIGHTLGAAGSFEAIMCARILRTGLIPATANCATIDPHCGLDVVIERPRRHSVHTALSTSSAFAGNNAAILLAAAAPGRS